MVAILECMTTGMTAKTKSTSILVVILRNLNQELRPSILLSQEAPQLRTAAHLALIQATLHLQVVAHHTLHMDQVALGEVDSNEMNKATFKPTRMVLAAGASGGIGVCNVSAPARGRATNNNAEIRAATEAAKQAQRAGVDRLKINTDSEFLVKCNNEWMPKWKQNDWTTSSGQPVKNREELMEMERAFKPLDVKLNHVPGHKGVYGNERADELARQGIRRH